MRAVRVSRLPPSAIWMLSPPTVAHVLTSSCGFRRAEGSPVTCRQSRARGRLAAPARRRREAELALTAFDRYGRGRGHPAQLNLGDCFAYAAASAHWAALLFKGEDFDKTESRGPPSAAAHAGAMTARLATRIGALALPNPMICGSGEPVMTASGIRAALAAGAAGVIAKSVNERPEGAAQLDRADYRLIPQARRRSRLCSAALAWRRTEPAEWFATLAAASTAEAAPRPLRRREPGAGRR